MTCYRIPNGIITIPDVYTLTLPSGKKLQFEYNAWVGPAFLCKDGWTLRKRVPAGGWEAFDKWLKRHLRKNKSKWS